jgi:hypothetical protein
VNIKILILWTFLPKLLLAIDISQTKLRTFETGYQITGGAKLLDTPELRQHLDMTKPRGEIGRMFKEEEISEPVLEDFIENSRMTTLRIGDQAAEIRVIGKTKYNLHIVAWYWSHTNQVWDIRLIAKDNVRSLAENQLFLEKEPAVKKPRTIY